MLPLVESISPQVLSGDRFIAHRESEPFLPWCESASDACLRRFSIRDTGDNLQPPITNTTEAWLTVIFEVLVAYPDNYRYGSDQGRTQDDVMRSDYHQVDGVLGLRGQPSFSGVAAWLKEHASAGFVQGNGVTFQRFTIGFEFCRSFP